MPKKFYQEKDKTWCIDTKIKVDGKWRHLKRKGYLTKGEAIADYDRIVEDFIKNNGSSSRKNAISELVKEYEKMRRIIVDQSTVEGDLSIFNNHIVPFFEDMSVKEALTEENVSKWYNSLIDNPKYTNSRKSKVITRMRDFLKFAYQHRYITAEAYQDCDVNIYQVKYSKKPKTERVVWTVEEEKSFLNAISFNRRDDIMFRTFLITSPRLGEFLGLQPMCFDHKRNKITVCQQVKNYKGRGSVLTEKLKTHDSYRTIAIPQSLSDELQQYIDDFGIKDDQFLWYSFNKNSPIGRNTIRRLFNSYCDKAGIRRLNLHALRHNQAVKWASVAKTGEEIEVCARRLGHSPSMFMNTYANHGSDTKERELLLKLTA